MAHPAADRVRVEWNGTGTGTMTLGSTVAGYQGFPAALNGVIVEYHIEHQGNAENESGFGVYSSAGPTLTRQYRTYPTKGGSAVNFSAGVKHVRLTATLLSLVPSYEVRDPTAHDDINAGYLEGKSFWLNTVANTFWVCTDHGGASPAAAVWVQLGGAGAGAVSSVNGSTGTVVLDAGDIAAVYTPPNYIPAGAGTSVRDHLEGINNALTGGADALPAQVVSNAAEYVLLVGSALHNNIEVRSHQANVDFEVPSSATAGFKWLIKPQHDGCTLSIDGDVGTVNGTAAGSVRLINSGIVYVEVDSVSGSPLVPAVLVRGNVIVPPVDVGGIKTYDNDDCDGEYRLTSTSTQTFSASANYIAGFEVIIYRETAGTIILDGVDADYTVSGPDIVNVVKVGTALMATGKAGVVILDAA